MGVREFVLRFFLKYSFSEGGREERRRREVWNSLMRGRGGSENESWSVLLMCIAVVGGL